MTEELKTEDINVLLVADALYSCRAFLTALSMVDAVKDGDREPQASHLMRKVTIALKELGVEPDLLVLPKMQSLKEFYTRKC